MERFKVKYKIIANFHGITNEFNFNVNEKSEAIACFKNVRMRADKTKFFSIDSEDNEIWYDLTNKY